MERKIYNQNRCYNINGNGSNLCFSEASSHKKKNRKKAKSAGVPTTSSTSLSVDSGFLCCAHHEVMVAGLTMLGVGLPQKKGASVTGFYSVVVVGDGRRMAN